jgi:hypothetical protein
MSKKTTKILAIITSMIFFVSLGIYITHTVYAAGTANTTSYTPLEPNAFNENGIGLTSGNSPIHTDLGTFLSDLFDFGIAIAVALSVVMISWGGILYMTTDSWMGKEDGKKKIQDALYGLALALVSWLILYTINPALVDFTGNKIVSP